MNHSIHLSNTQQDQLRKLYHQQFANSGNKLTHQGLYNLLNLSGIGTTHQEVNRIYSLIDADNNGVIDQTEFLKYMETAKNNFNVHLELESIFETMTTHSGIPINVFKEFVCGICPNLTQKEAQNLSSQIDIDMDGFIKKEQFMYIFTVFGKKEAGCSGKKQ